MTGQRKERLKAAGVDVDEALGRVLGNEALLERLLAKFADSPQLHQLEVALGQGDGQAVVAAAHTLKGVCGNLSITPLYQLFTRQVDTFRAGDPQGAAAMMGEIAEQFDLAARAIQSLGDHGC